MSLECSRSMITQTHFLPAHDLSIQLTPSSWYSLRVRPSSLSKAFNGLKWEGLRSVCGACVAPLLPVAAGGTTNGGCHGGGVLFHSGLEGSTLEVVDSSFFNNSAQCGGGLMVTGRGTAVLTNSSFYDNIAGLSGVGSGVGGGLAAYSADSDVRVQQQWYASGSKVTLYVSTARSMC